MYHLFDLLIDDVVDHGVFDIPKDVQSDVLDNSMLPLGHEARKQFTDPFHIMLNKMVHMVQLRLQARVQLNELSMVQLKELAQLVFELYRTIRTTLQKADDVPERLKVYENFL